MYQLNIYSVILIVVLPWILISSKLFCQQMHSLLKHEMLQFTLTISLYMAPKCFGLFGPSSGSIRRNLIKVTVFVEIITTNISLKLCCAVSTCASVSSVCTGCCAACDTRRTAPSTQNTYSHSTATFLTTYFYYKFTAQKCWKVG
jgi:hypothetical protein